MVHTQLLSIRFLVYFCLPAQIVSCCFYLVVWLCAGLRPVFSHRVTFCSTRWTVTEHESSQFRRPASARFAAAHSETGTASSARRAPLRPRLRELREVLLQRISPALVSLPIKRFLSSAFLFGNARASGSTIGFCPVNSDNNDCFRASDWTAPECGSSEFSRATSANLAVLS